MRKDKIAYFVSFETNLNSDEFISQWSNYTSSATGKTDITLQQNEKDGKYKYLAQHRNDLGEFQFVTTKAIRVFQQSRAEVKIKQLGGYTMTQSERTEDTRNSERKIFVFASQANGQLKDFKAMKTKFTLNVYESYFENCSFAVIYEFFAKANDIEKLLQELNDMNIPHPEIYKECSLSMA